MSTCASASRELDEPLTATAPEARVWLLLEQPGPWGAKALTSSHLDPSVGRELEARAKGTGVRVALIRRPGRHPDRHRAQRHQVIVASAIPGGAWVRRTALSDPRALLDLDLTALGIGDHGGIGQEHSGDPVALVCTNGKRDRCCALLGRPLAAELHAMGGTDVWEITHLGGHRFSPTMLVLPYGYVYGRLSPQDAKEVLEATRRGKVPTTWCRGRSAWGRAGQAAELAVRELTGEDLADALSVERVRRTDEVEPGAGAGAGAGAEGQGWAVRVRHVDGRLWAAAVCEHPQTPPRPESCGAALGRPSRLAVTAIVPLPWSPVRHGR